MVVNTEDPRLVKLGELERAQAEDQSTLRPWEEDDHDEDRRMRSGLAKKIRDRQEIISGLRSQLGVVEHGMLLPFNQGIVVASIDLRRLLVDLGQRPREALFELSPRQFEEFVADLWHRFGYEVELTKRTRDGGRDIIAVRRAETDLRVLIECKRYKTERKIDVGLVRQLYGTKLHERATKAILATTSYFSHPAMEFFDSHWWELEPRDYDGVLNWVALASKK